MGLGLDGVRRCERDERLRRYSNSQLTVGEFFVWERGSVAAFHHWRKRLACGQLRRRLTGTRNGIPNRPHAAQKTLLLPEEFCRIEQHGAPSFGG
jgi:hypothetical protein